MKVSVLASGRILLDEREVSLAELEEELRAAKIRGATVQYYRENPRSEAPPEADAVMKLITANRLRIALFTEPDFRRDSNVIEFPGFEVLFSKVRRQAAASRGVSIVRPDQSWFVLPAPPQGTIDAKMINVVKGVIPSEQPRNVAAVAAAGALAIDAGQTPAMPDVARRVPFFGLLIGLAYTGHAVWMFEASSALMSAGCEDADVLIIDSNALATLPSGWAVDAGAVMRNPNILVYDRHRQKVGAMRTAGEVPGRIEFPN